MRFGEDSWERGNGEREGRGARQTRMKRDGWLLRVMEGEAESEMDGCVLCAAAQPPALQFVSLSLEGDMRAGMGIDTEMCSRQAREKGSVHKRNRDSSLAD